MNMMFIAIKVDREERPDLDAVNMAACQAVNGSGGWPLTVFMTPDRRAFAAGTYYPPEDRDGQMGLPTIMTTIFNYWRMRRDLVDEQAARISEAVAREIAFVDSLQPLLPRQSWSSLNHKLTDELIERAVSDGGFTDAPKFPRPSYIDALLHRWYDDTAQRVVRTTLDAMARGGIYDHLAGGFARYSVDALWRVPHFEKMLSDQALLAHTYLQASRLPGASPEWRDVAHGTLDFALAELDLGNGFASSLDADSAGHEGAHATFTPQEVRAALLEHPALINDALHRWTVSEKGDLDGRSVLRLAPEVPFVTPEVLTPALVALRAARATRPRPSRDEKVVLEWNAMLAVALLAAGDHYAARGRRLVEELFTTHFSEGRWFRTDAHNADATAADLGWLIRASLEVYGLDGDDEWRRRSHELTRYLMIHHWDGELPSTSRPDVGQGVITSSNLILDFEKGPKEIFDGATPSVHAVVTDAFARLALINDDTELMALARRMVALGGPLVVEHPSAVPDLVAASALVFDPIEIVVPGTGHDLHRELQRHWRPPSVVVVGVGTSPLLTDRAVGEAYLCRGHACELPARDVALFAQQLERLAT
jgi:uncharacterized protein YyaL (SSP411 family)